MAYSKFVSNHVAGLGNPMLEVAEVFAVIRGGASHRCGAPNSFDTGSGDDDDDDDMEHPQIGDSSGKSCCLDYHKDFSEQLQRVSTRHGEITARVCDSRLLFWIRTDRMEDEYFFWRKIVLDGNSHCHERR